ncbi:PIN domain-containing protein [Halosimplex litoreum]|uniref:Ribonuclease VapC n=1 Tax=Halosimplex litoreum TaxID=1198301 RepID=A0A7T3FV42_9EURY|nr:PIN domain-containing protein [Halosimplex litoreum]QPV61264.1 PIN domain-containing protein [Halosimplex litoreum]
MTFLDTSTIIQYLSGDERVRAHIEGREPWLTSTICVFEVINGRLGSGETDIVAVRQDFAGVQALDLNESVAIEAARLQDELIDDGERLATADLLIAATARSTGDELVVADGDFETEALEDAMQVTNLRT